MVTLVANGLLVGISLAMPIGPVLTETIRRGLAFGFLPAWQVTLGAATAHVIFVALTYLGLLATLDQPGIHLALGAAGVLVLGYLGIGAIRTGVSPEALRGQGRQGRPYVVGFGISIGNPITILWFLTIGAGLIARHTEGAGRAAVGAFLVSLLLGIFLWDTLVAAVAGWSSRWTRPAILRGVNVVSGLILLGFATSLGWQVGRRLLLG